MEPFFSGPPGRRPVPGREVRVESVGVHAPDRYHVDVALDLTPSQEGTRIELAIEEPSGAELVSMTMVENRQWALDRRLHLKRPPEDGTHTLHVGVFYQDELIQHVRRQFSFPPPGQPESPDASGRGQESGEDVRSPKE